MPPFLHSVPISTHMAFDLAFVSPRSTPFVTRFISALRTLITTFTTENPLVWGFLGGKNRRADVEGASNIVRESCTLMVKELE